ncbi:MAG: type II secretion system F family protein [Candidatus Hermodarchaeia archaeon]
MGTTILLLGNLLPILSAMVLGITFGLLTGLIFLNSILSKYQKQLVQIERATPHVLEELVTLFLTTGSVFESIEYVSKGDYGSISEAFATMIVPLNFGTPPEQLLRRFATSQPSMTLRRGLLTFIQFIESSSTNLESVITDAHEDLQRRYQMRTMQWESRMMVIAGVLVFLPIIFILGASIRGLANHPLVLLLPVSQFILSKLMISALLPKELILLGE